MPLVVLLLLPMAAGLVAAVLPARARSLASAIAGLATALGFAWVAQLFPRIEDGAVITERFAWVPALGLDIVFRLDGLSWVFSILVLGIGALVMLYARYYLAPTDPAPRFYGFLLAFIAAMMGVVLAGNLLQLALFWELTSLLSFLLISYWNDRKDAQRGARMALIVTGAGGLCLLAGVVLLGVMAGSYDFDVVILNAPSVRSHALYPAALGLILIGVFTKSAQLPFHFWLPHAMAAPTPVSAYLHSATLVKLGIFLLARFWPVLSGTELWFWTLSCVGLCTLLFGAWVALFQRDLKGLLAYSTISHLGLITLLFGLNTPLAAVAAVFHALNHAAFKASLFMAVGIIDHETGTRDIRRLSGLFRLMPVTSTLALVATAAMAGVPLLNGFISKEMFFAEATAIDAIPVVQWGLPIVATLAGVGSVAYSLRFALEVFFGPASALDTPRKPEEPPRWMRVPVQVLVVICLVVGIVPGASVGPFLAAAAHAVVNGAPPEYSLKVWHGFTPALLMSGLALAGGALLYFVVHRVIRRQPRERVWLDGAHLFFGALAWLSVFARRLRVYVLTAGLQRQLLALVCVTLVVGFVSLYDGVGAGDRPLIPLSPVFAALWLIGGAAGAMAAYQAKYRRLTALLLSGVAGAMCCVTFIWFSAPDLALTQLSVEIVTMLLILLGLRWLPPREQNRGIFNARTRRSAAGRRLRDGVVAAAAGLGMALLSYAVMTRDFPLRTSFFLEKALSEGGGRNVVNVMLVDFRGFDTFGEGVVLALVALTVYALLRRFRPAPELMALTPQQRALSAERESDLVSPGEALDPLTGYLLVPTVLARVILPVSGVVAVFFFLRGHDEPGGGFVAGLVMAVGLLVQYIVSGTKLMEEKVNLRPRLMIGAGLLCVLCAAAGPFVVGYPLLTSHTFHVTLPLLGEIHVPSATLFDLGVFAVVLGSTLLILVALAHQSIRARRAASLERGGD